MRTYLGIELKRIVRAPLTFIFSLGIPALMYLIFGASMDYGSQRVAHGNVAAFVMINMACYAAVTCTSGIGGMSVLEKNQGWGRQLSLTPMPNSRFVAVKVFSGVFQTILPVAIIYILGAHTGARADAWVWLSSGCLVLLGAALFSLYGLAVSAVFSSDGALRISSGLVVILGFFGNLFVPLSGVLLSIAKFTPLYGLGALARRPLTDGYSVDTAGVVHFEPLWQITANLAVWTLIFGLLTLIMMKRERNRE